MDLDIGGASAAGEWVWYVSCMGSVRVVKGEALVNALCFVGIFVFVWGMLVWRCGDWFHRAVTLNPNPHFAPAGVAVPPALNPVQVPPVLNPVLNPVNPVVVPLVLNPVNPVAVPLVLNPGQAAAVPPPPQQVAPLPHQVYFTAGGACYHTDANCVGLRPRRHVLEHRRLCLHCEARGR